MCGEMGNPRFKLQPLHKLSLVAINWATLTGHALYFLKRTMEITQHLVAIQERWRIRLI